MTLRNIDTRWFKFHPHSYGIATLMRVGFRAFGWQLMLHHFRPHREEKFHDHPWAFRTWVLWGTYVDESLANDDSREPIRTDVLRAPCTRYRAASHIHRTRSDGHVVTVVLARPKSRQWRERDTNGRWHEGGIPEDFDATVGMRS